MLTTCSRSESSTQQGIGISRHKFKKVNESKESRAYKTDLCFQRAVEYANSESLACKILVIANLIYVK